MARVLLRGAPPKAGQRGQREAILELQRAGVGRRRVGELRVVLLDLLAANGLELGLRVVELRRAEHLDEGDAGSAVVGGEVAEVEAAEKVQASRKT